MILVPQALDTRDLVLTQADLALRLSRPSLWAAVIHPAGCEGFTGIIESTPAHSMVNSMIRSVINHHVPLRVSTRVATSYWSWGEDSGWNPHITAHWHAQIYVTHCDQGGARLAPGVSQLCRGHMIITPPGGVISVSRVRSGPVITVECGWV